MNNVVLVGRICNDLELKNTNSGLSVTNFSIAVDRYSKDKEKSANFINCVAYGATAENLVKHQEKGRKIAITGSWNVDQWESEDGKHRRDYCYVSTWEFADNKPKEETKPKFEPVSDDEELPWQ